MTSMTAPDGNGTPLSDRFYGKVIRDRNEA
jgi:hypothetical protein